MNPKLLAALAAIPTPELRAALTEMASVIGDNVEGQKRFTEITTMLTTTDATVKVVRSEIQKVTDEFTAFRKQVEDEKKAQREQRIAETGIRTADKAFETLGIIVRQQLIQKGRHQEVAGFDPKKFENERAIYDGYMQRATLQAGATPGSILIPTVTEAMLFDAIEEISEFVNETDFKTGLVSNLILPGRTGRPHLQPMPASVDTERTRQSMNFGSITFTPKEVGFLFPVDNKLLLMSAVDLGRVVYSTMMETAVNDLGYWAMWADGTAAYAGITGVMKSATPQQYVLPAGGVSMANIADTDLQSGKAQTFLRSQNSGKWVYGSYMDSVVTNLNRLGKVPLYTYDNGGQRKLLGNEVMIDPNMTVQKPLADMPEVPADGPDQGFAMFGNMKGLFVGLAGNVQLAASSDYLFGQNQTAFRLVMYLDIQAYLGRHLAVFKTAKK